MQWTFRALSLLPLFFLANCANFSPKAPPPDSTGTPIPVYFSDRLPTDMEKVVTYSIPDSYFGVTPHQRGSAAVGLLFGPLGVAANIAYMQDAAKKAAAGGEALFAENLPRLVNAEASRLSIVTANDRQGRRYEIIPTVAIQFESDTQYHFTCNTWVYLFDEQREIWRARYASSPGGVYSADMLGTDTGLRSDIRACLITTLGLFDLHRTSSPEAYRKAEIEAEIWIGDVTLVGQVVSGLLPERVIYYDFLGLWELDKRKVKQIKLE